MMGDMEKVKRRKDEIRTAVSLATTALKPIGAGRSARRDILGIVETLEARGFEKETSDEIANRIDAEWLQDLSVFPRALIFEAARRWRTTTGRNRPPYASGDLMKMVEKDMRELKLIKSKGERALRLAGLKL